MVQILMISINIPGKEFFRKAVEYTFDLCKKEEAKEVREFIDEYWSNGHVLVKNEKLFDWQFYDRSLNRYNFVLARDKKTNDIHGIYGYIPVSQFDKALFNNRDVWLSIWKVCPKARKPWLGLALLSFVIYTTKPRCLIGIKSSEIAKAIFRKLSDFRQGMLNHYYMINKNKSIFRLIGNFDGNYCSPSHSDPRKTLEELKNNEINSNNFSLFFNSGRIPTKSPEYLRNRFLKHPVYEYKLYKILSSNIPSGVIVTRLQEQDESKAIRIVDYFGSETALEGLFPEFQRLLIEHDAEYLDFYNYGFSEDSILQGGFLKRDTASKIVVPNYFEPFEKRNIDLDFVVKCNSNVIICKADSEQDRPNKL